jgi:hypothetical protein
MPNILNELSWRNGQLTKPPNILEVILNIIEPCHDKTNIVRLRPTWIQISLQSDQDPCYTLSVSLLVVGFVSEQHGSWSDCADAFCHGMAHISTEFGNSRPLSDSRRWSGLPGLNMLPQTGKGFSVVFFPPLWLRSYHYRFRHQNCSHCLFLRDHKRHINGFKLLESMYLFA